MLFLTGWLVFQRHSSSAVTFHRGWGGYKDGFGNLANDFWLGNEKLHRITKFGGYTIRLDIVTNNLNKYAKYDDFRIGDESQMYKLTLGDYSGMCVSFLNFVLKNQFGLLHSYRFTTMNASKHEPELSLF